MCHARDVAIPTLESETAPRAAPTRVAWAALAVAAVALAVALGGWFARTSAEPGPDSVSPLSVPMVSAMTVDEARAVLAQQGLKLGKVTTLPVRAVPRDTIAYQTPRLGSSVAPGTVVDVWVSAGPDTSPNPKCVVLGGRNTCSNAWSFG